MCLRTNCYLVTFDGKKCVAYNKLATIYLIPDAASKLYINYQGYGMNLFLNEFLV